MKKTSLDLAHDLLKLLRKPYDAATCDADCEAVEMAALKLAHAVISEAHAKRSEATEGLKDAGRGKGRPEGKR